GMPVIDSDVHVPPPEVEALYRYLPAHWVEHVKQSAFKGPRASYYPPHLLSDPSQAASPEESGLEALRRSVLDGGEVEMAIVNCLYAIDSLHNPEAAVDFARAANDWLVEEWLDRDDRLRASMVVPVQLPEEAAQEIDRVGGHPGFVQVLLPVRTEHPLGSRLHRPLWTAIARQGLVAGIHYGGAPGNPPFPSGWPSHHFEEHAGMAQVAQSQLCSIVAEGVFDLFPDLRVTVSECGFTWLPAFMWRFDKEWRNLRRLVPWVKRAPSAYLRDHVRFTVQPLDAPPTPELLNDLVDQIGSEEMLLFASDYPHRHVADPARDLLPGLSDELAKKVGSENAKAWYRR
ncbi:MAG: amidohydrolase, partial [Candidatus Dormibacteraeota bacterium]|nr:amidohydrolase [Candidatus Dormibacteraeota bacterium]